MTELINPDRPMRADARRNRARVLKAARELFASEDPDVQIDDVARRAGVGVGTVYRHFPDKYALMGELVRERFALFNERLAVALSLSAEGARPFAALTDTLRENARSLADDAATRFAFMSGGERVFGHAAAEYEEFMRLARELVAQAHASGELRSDFEALDIPMVMCGTCAAMDHRKAGWDWERYMELVIGGMRAPAAATRRVQAR